MVVGESPDTNEARLNTPFLGRSGRILDALLAQAGLKREETFITHAVMCNPPRHDKSIDEDFPHAVPSCRPRLLEEIAHYEPRVIVALGRAALLSMTGREIDRVKQEKKPTCTTCAGACRLAWYKCEASVEGGLCKTRVPFRADAPLFNCPVCSAIGGGVANHPEAESKLAKTKMMCPECEGKKTVKVNRKIFESEHKINFVAGAVFDGLELGLPMVQYVIPSYHPTRIMQKAETKAQRSSAGQFLFSPALEHFKKARRLLSTDRAWPFGHRVFQQGPDQAIELKRWMDARIVYSPEGFYTADYFTIDLETDAKEPFEVTDIRCVGIAPMYVSNPMGEACQPIVVDTEGLPKDHPTVLVLRNFFVNPRVRKAGQNAILYDSQTLWAFWGFECQGFEEDTLYAHSSVAPDENHDLQHIALTYTDSPAWKPPKNKNGHQVWESKEQLHLYNARDVWNTSLSLETGLRREMAVEQSAFVYKLNILKAHVARGMDRVGMPVDPEKYLALRDEAVKQKPIWLNKLRDTVKRPDFNPNAPAQLASVLYGPGSLCGFVPTSFTKTGAPSTKAEALFQFRKHPFVADLLEFRKWRGMVSNFFGNPPEEITYNEDGEEEDWVQEKGIIVSDDWRIRFRWNPIGARTGRWSGSPNPQNWPEEMRAIISTEKLYRRMITGADMPQAELRVIAALSGDDKLIELCINADEDRKFDPKYDPHSYVASIAFPNYLELPEWAEKTDQATGKTKRYSPRKGLRDAVKAVIYGLNYGAGAAKVLETISTDPRYDGPPLSLDMVERIIAAIYAAFPKVRRYREKVIEASQSTGYVRDALINIRRVYPLLDVPATEGSNYAIQATVASMMDMSIIEFVHALPSVDPSAFLMSQVHDALYAEDDEDKAPMVEHLMSESMSQMIRLTPNAPMMPFVVKAKSHKIWAALG